MDSGYDNPFGFTVLADGNGGFMPCPTLLTEEEAIRYLRLDTLGRKDPSKTLQYYRERGLIKATRISNVNFYTRGITGQLRGNHDRSHERKEASMSRRVKMSKDPRNKGKPWVVRWTDGIDLVTGKTKWSAKSFKYKLEAQDFAAEKRTESRDISQAVGTPYRMTLGRFLNEWSLTRDNNDYQSGTRTLDGNTVVRLTAHFGKHTPARRYHTDGGGEVHFHACTHRWQGQAAISVVEGSNATECQDHVQHGNRVGTD